MPTALRSPRRPSRSGSTGSRTTCCRSWDRFQEASHHQSMIRAPASSRSPAWPRSRTTRPRCSRSPTAARTRRRPPPTASSRSPSTTATWTATSRPRTYTSRPRRRTFRRRSISTRTTRRRSARTMSPGFTEGALPVAVVGDVSIVDSDSPALASATITLTNPQASDTLTFNGAAPGSIVVSGSGTNIITLTGVSSQADYKAALQQIQFNNTDIDPSNVTRVINIVVNDGTGDSNTAHAFVQVEAVNNAAPVVDLDPDDSSGSLRSTFRTTFTENGAPVPIADTDTLITEVDSTNLVSATITLSNRQTDDLLTVSGALPAGITASTYDPVTGILALTGSATLAEYQAALQQIQYSNTGDNPATEDRLIEVVVNDGANDSNVADAVIGVAAVNDAPALVVANATHTENNPPLALSPLASVTDPDDTELNFAVVRIADGSFPGDGDTLSVGGLTSGTVNDITFAWDPALHALTFSGASSLANYQALLQTVEFQSTSDNPTNFNANPHPPVA